MKIWKYPLVEGDEQIIEMPLDAKILTVQVQNDIPCLWVAVIQTNVMVQRRIRIVGTGHTLMPYYSAKLTINGYIGTIQTHGGLLVWHVFDEGKKI